jgi:zinc transporter ZupT
VHAAADGLAVGVASVSPSIKLAIAVGAAMVLHKGPVSLGLGASLVSQKLPTETVILVRAVWEVQQLTCPACNRHAIDFNPGIKLQCSFL